MINKFFKIIHNKYSRFLRFIFFLRYLIVIFFIAVAIFLFIPYFFNYENRADYLKKYLTDNYDIQILKYEKIEFSPLPIPKLEFKKAFTGIGKSEIQMEVKNLKIYPKLLSIYNYENFQSNKIHLKDTRTILETSELLFLIKELTNQKKKLYLNNLDLIIENNNKSIVTLKNIKFSNFGYQKNKIDGEIFGKKFKMFIGDDFEHANFKILNSGININVDFDEKREIFKKGVLKSKILNSNFKFNFIYDDHTLDIYNSYFRSKNISFINKSRIIFTPFLEIESKFDIEDINIDNLKKIQLDKILKIKEILKLVNFKNELNFTSKKFSFNKIEKMTLKTDLAYGRLNYSKSLTVSDIFLKCHGNINLLEEFPLLFFNCNIFSNDKRIFFSKLGLNKDKNNEVFNLNIEGNLSTLNKKINLKKITLNESYVATKEDLSFYKKSFESIVLNESLLEMFNFKKLKEFILEIS